MTELYPLRFRPILRHYLWGGRRLAELLNKDLGEFATAAESWEICARGEDQSVVLHGPLAGFTLADLISRYSEALVGNEFAGRRFPFLLKFLDAAEPLSVQVHPDDATAARADPPDSGKTEAWVVVSAAAGSTIYAGLKPGVDRTALNKALDAGCVHELLHSFRPQRGDCIVIPAGTVHALGPGLVVYELQQSSDITYRLFDWCRLGPDGRPRPLHIEQALEVIDFSRGPIAPIRLTPISDGRRQRLAQCPYFTLDRISAEFGQTVALGGDMRMHLIAVISGAAQSSEIPGPSPLKAGDTFLIPAVVGPIALIAGADGMEILDAYGPCDF